MVLSAGDRADALAAGRSHLLLVGPRVIEAWTSDLIDEDGDHGLPIETGSRGFTYERSQTGPQPVMDWEVGHRGAIVVGSVAIDVLLAGDEHVGL